MTCKEIKVNISIFPCIEQGDIDIYVGLFDGDEIKSRHTISDLVMEIVDAESIPANNPWMRQDGYENAEKELNLFEKNVKKAMKKARKELKKRLATRDMFDKG